MPALLQIPIDMAIAGILYVGEQTSNGNAPILDLEPRLRGREYGVCGKAAVSIKSGCGLADRQLCGH